MSMWNFLKKIDGAWAQAAAVVGIFTLGFSACAFIMEKADQGSAVHAGAVNTRINDLSSSFDRVVVFVKEQLGILKSDQDNVRKEVASQYQAINARLDQQNILIVEVLKTVKSQKSEAAAQPKEDDGWSLIESANAAIRKARKN